MFIYTFKDIAAIFGYGILAGAALTFFGLFAASRVGRSKRGA